MNKIEEEKQKCPRLVLCKTREEKFLKEKNKNKKY